MKYAVVNQFIVEANDGGTLPLNSKLVLEFMEGYETQAEQIVRCVNHHNEVVEALEWITEMAGYAEDHLDPEWASYPTGHSNRRDYADALTQARNILAKVKK